MLTNTEEVKAFEGNAVSGAIPLMVVPDFKSVGCWVLTYTEEVVRALDCKDVKGVAHPMVVQDRRMVNPDKFKLPPIVVLLATLNGA